jgi:hypothetical protein
MRQVLAATDRSLLESARLALAAEDIETLVANDNAALPFGPVTLAVVHDDDYERAVAIVKEVEGSASAGQPRGVRAHRTALLVILAVIASIILICGFYF